MIEQVTDAHMQANFGYSNYAKAPTVDPVERYAAGLASSPGHTHSSRASRLRHTRTALRLGTSLRLGPIDILNPVGMQGHEPGI